MIRYFLFGSLLLGQLIGSKSAQAENSFEGQNFKVQLSLRENRDRSLSLLSVRPNAEYAASVAVSPDECGRPSKRWSPRKISIGIYPLADQVISKILIDARMGIGPWPKPLNLPQLTSWDLNVAVSPEALSTRESVSSQDIKELLIKQLTDRSIVRETGVLRATVSQRLACDILSGAVRVSAVAHIRFMHPDKDIYRPFSAPDLRQVYRSLFNQFSNFASHSLIRKNYELARVLDDVTGDHSETLKPRTLAEISGTFFSEQGELNPFTEADAQKLEDRLTEYSDRIIELDLETRNNPILTKDLR